MNLRAGANNSPILEENKRKIMQSSIFGGDPQPQQRSPQRQMPQQEIPQYKAPQKVEYRAPPRNDQQPKSNYSFAAPSSVSLPSFSGLVYSSNVPALSSFPSVNLNPISSSDTYSFSLKPRTALRPPQRSLTFKPNNQMKMMRDSLAQDMSSFQQRIQRLGVSTPLVIKMATFEHKTPKTAVPPQRTPLAPPAVIASPIKSSQSRKPANDNVDSNKFNGKTDSDANHSFNSSMNASMNDSMNESLGNSMNKPVNMSITSLNSSMGAPGFTTVSEFIMPDGSNFE
jgi:hypothetical protein